MNPKLIIDSVVLIQAISVRSAAMIVRSLAMSSALIACDGGVSVTASSQENLNHLFHRL